MVRQEPAVIPTRQERVTSAPSQLRPTASRISAASTWVMERHAAESKPAVCLMEAALTLMPFAANWCSAVSRRGRDRNALVQRRAASRTAHARILILCAASHSAELRLPALSAVQHKLAVCRMGRVTCSIQSAARSLAALRAAPDRSVPIRRHAVSRMEPAKISILSAARSSAAHRHRAYSAAALLKLAACLMDHVRIWILLAALASVVHRVELELSAALLQKHAASLTAHVRISSQFAARCLAVRRKVQEPLAKAMLMVMA